MIEDQPKHRYLTVLLTILISGVLFGLLGYKLGMMQYAPVEPVDDVLTPTTSSPSMPLTSTATTTIPAVTSSTTSTTATPAPSSPVASDDTANWLVYSDDNSGTTLEIPKDIVTNGLPASKLVNGIPQGLAAGITSGAIASLSIPGEYGSYDKSVLEAEKAGIEAGKFVDVPYTGNIVMASKKIVRLADGRNAKSYIVTGGGVDCSDRQVSRYLIVYNKKNDNDYRVTIALSPNQSQILKENPSYFGQETGCTSGNEQILTKKDAFYADVSAGKLTGFAQEWYTTFDKMVSTIAFTK